MTDRLDKLELRSEEVQEILSQVPNWMLRFGSVLILGIVVLVLVLSWLIKYPDLIQTETIVTTLEPPQKVYARITGKIDSIYVVDGEIVKSKSVLAVLENPANAEDIYYLKSILDTIDVREGGITFPMNEMPILLLGNAEMAYAEFENSYSEYKLNQSLNPFNNEAMANEASLNELRTRLQNMQSQYALNQSELELKRNDLKRNKDLLDKGVISLLDYENKQLEVISAEKGFKNLGASISQVREAIANATKNIKGTEITRTREESKLLRNTYQAFNQLKKAIKDWEYTFVLRSDIEGRVSFLNYWSSNQTVQQDDLVFTIIPEDNNDYVAKVKAAAQNSGKIKVGQNVNIKLQNYPDTEFGMLRGKVASISQVPDKDGFYLVDVSLPERLVTSYNKDIEFHQEMSGTAEIVTEDLRLIERFFYQFRKVFDQQ